MRRGTPQDERSHRGKAEHPVVVVSWIEVPQYCEWLGPLLNTSARAPAELKRLLAEGRREGPLPSEAEWEQESLLTNWCDGTVR